MKVAVSAAKPDLTARVDPRFGRCAAFVIVDPETMEWKAMENVYAGAAGGAGIQTAQMIGNEGVGVVLTGNCGPNAHQTLSAAGIEVVTGVTGRVDEAVDAYKQGRVHPTARPNVPAHSGTPSGTGAGQGMGSGRGMGRGMGRGQSMAASDVPSADVGGLADQLRALTVQLDALNKRLDAVERKQR